MQNDAVSLTLFAFEKDEEISTHQSEGDAMVTVLEGKGKFTVGGVEHIVSKVKHLLCRLKFLTQFMVKKDLSGF